MQPLVAGDLATVVMKDDLAGADFRRHPQPGEADRQRVLVLPHRRQRLAVHPRRRMLARVERVGRQRPQQIELLAERLTDGLATSADRAPQVGDARRRQQVVELPQRTDLRDRHQVGAAESADVALDPASPCAPSLPTRVKLDS